MDGERTCPACGAAGYPTYRICPHCGATTADPDWDALDMLRDRIVGLDAQVSELLTQRQSLVEQYERHRFAIFNRARPGTPFTGTAAAGPVLSPQRSQEWSGARVRALMLGLGATLLAASALTFTAVAWSRLGDGGRAVLLFAATVLITALALALRRRLPMTAEAFAGLAIVLALVDLYAVRRAGVAQAMSWQVWWALGTAAAAGFAAALGRATGRRTTRFAVVALLPVSAQLLAHTLDDTHWADAVILAAVAAVIVDARTRWARHLYPEDRVVLGLHAVVSWVSAAVIAGSAAYQAVTVAGAGLPALAVGSLAVAPELARRRLAAPALRTAAAALAAGVPAGVALTLAAPLVGTDGLLTTAVIAGAVTILAVSLAARGHLVGGVIAGTAYLVPGVLRALSFGVPAAVGPLAWLTDPWGGTVRAMAREAYLGPSVSGSWAAVGSLGAIAAAALVLGVARPLFVGIASAAIGFAIALIPVAAGTTVLLALVAAAGIVVVILLVSGWADRRQAGRGWAMLPGAAVAAVPAVGWAAVSPAASVVTSALTALAAGAAAVIARSPAARAVYAVLAALLAVTFVGTGIKAAGAGAPAAGFATAVAGGAVLLFAVFLLRGQPVVAVAVEAAGAVAAIAGAALAADSRAWLAGALTALVPVAALAALRTDRRVVYAGAAGALALSATWAWLDAAGVSLVEAYTAPAAVVALAAGITRWRTGPGRSWITLGPALLLAIGPTLVLGMADDDAVRLFVAALLSLATVVAGGVLRLQAPLCLGAVALLSLAIDQWGDEIVRMPRWITLGIVGVLLMWVGATFEHRRRDWRRTSEVVGRFG